MMGAFSELEILTSFDPLSLRPGETMHRWLVSESRTGSELEKLPPLAQWLPVKAASSVASGQ